MGRYAISQLSGVMMDELAALLARHLVRRPLPELPEPPEPPSEELVFANDGFAFHAVGRRGQVASLHLQLRGQPADATLHEREAALAILEGIGFAWSGALVGEDGTAFDLTDEVALRRWLGLPQLPVPDEALRRVEEALARGERVDDRTLSIALQAERAEDVLDRLAPHATLAAWHVPDARLAAIAVGTRDAQAVKAFARTFDGAAALGSPGAHVAFGNACRKRFRERGIAPRTLTGARACLLCEARRSMHTASNFEGDWPYIDALLAAIAAATRRP